MKEGDIFNQYFKDLETGKWAQVYFVGIGGFIKGYVDGVAKYVSINNVGSNGRTTVTDNDNETM